MNHLQTPSFAIGRALPVLMPIGQVGEQICIAMVGQEDSQGFWARSVCPKPITGLPGELGHAVASFGSIVAADFVEWCTKGRDAGTWRPPLGGLIIGEWIDVSGFDFEDLIRVAVSLAGLGGSAPEARSGRTEATSLAPRTSDESRFLEAVRSEVALFHPGLVPHFHRGFSLTGKSAIGEIDFVGSGYVTCYAAVNPKGRAISRTQTASAALWRLARARDAFGFAVPTAIELTAWIPPPGLPIFSGDDYAVVNETISELKAQAQREELGVFPVFDVSMACRRLVEQEFQEPRH